ncbi:class-II fumarase/aspartase family protein [Oceanisphaera psychrotolerans]|uniref:3-carboxy-cis,cis-muconate cycloisomerase n=1 Tax=Oceanisphaera psychrotolerans TaxID=1414654 RepID=A0A1J4QGD7_9GAMM|nr:adenylosuccinate lyase family protein [Oceanisphaera psychrotolerans]OIN09139.1 3-carboxy-cis,cis-muconate cycloisomerase [Oceanisphaera psychrotolerans]
MTSSILDSKIFAPLFHSQEMQAVFNDDARVKAFLDTEAALARAQAKLEMIPTEAARQIDQAAGSVQIDMDRLAHDTGTVGYPILGLVRQLAAAAGKEAGGFVHWGATTQDIMDTASVLQIRDGLALIDKDLKRVEKALMVLAREHRDTVMAGRTHLQHALPVTFGYKAAIWLDSVRRAQQRLEQMRPRVLNAQLWGAAGTLASIGERAELLTDTLAKELDLFTPIAPWHATRDGFAEAGCNLALMTGSLSKIAFDIMIMCMDEISETAEPFVKDRGASSTMPQKRNPISCEVIRGCNLGVAKAAALLMDAQEADFERATGPWHAEWIALPQVFVLAHCALSQAVFLLEGLEVFPDKMARNLDISKGLIVAESAMMALAPHVGRQTAHDIVYDACREAQASGSSLYEALLEQSEVTRYIDAEALKKIVSPSSYLGLSQHIVDRVLAG